MMNLALNCAKTAKTFNEVPIGAVITDDNNEIIALAHNEVITNNDATAHAEILAIRRACAKLHANRLENCKIFITCEPCPMCAGAIMHASLKQVIFGAYAPKTGAIDHGVCLFNHRQTNHKPEIIGGVMRDECAALLQEFFQNLR